MNEQEMRKRYMRAALRNHGVLNMQALTDLELMESFLLIPAPAMTMQDFSETMEALVGNGEENVNAVPASIDISEEEKQAANRVGLDALKLAIKNNEGPGVTIGERAA